ncbi:MAG: hypothetical protein CMF50_10790 [Legionellales bacterium]|nr:hypothetical protein [Legionellales bacterium]|tara:strand:+ start:7036 stop:8628 length:1593 start_codon:yes stop_codon:yes gene_type:complete
MKDIAVIGGGWYGSHIALELRKKGHNVTLYEKNPRLFSNISGLFGIRLHIGPHYPRSKATRRSCLYGFQAFTTKYPELIVPHDYSVYAVGNSDASGMASKVSADDFVEVCKEHSRCKVFYDTEEKGYKNLQVAVELDEPSVYIGRGLHDFFERKLTDAGVNIIYNYNAVSAHKTDSEMIQITSDNGQVGIFDYAVNATSFQALMPNSRINLPFNTVYQPCLALVYEDLAPTSEKPFSFIVMDGWFPCMMPAVDYGKDATAEKRQYILTHGMWTIMASYSDVNSAREHLSTINDQFIGEKIRPNCEKEMNRFFPAFGERFRYVKWVGTVLAKVRNNREFRSSITFRDTDSGMIYVLPGKVSNIFDAEIEVEALIDGRDIIHNEGNGYSYVKDGTLDTALPEFREEVIGRNTCDLQTFRLKEIKDPPIVKQAITKQARLKNRTTANMKLLVGLALIIAFNESACESPNPLVRLFIGLAFLASCISLIIRYSGVSSFEQLPTFFQYKSGTSGHQILLQNSTASGITPSSTLMQ